MGTKPEKKKAADLDLTFEALLEEMQRIPPDAKDGRMSTREIAERMGVCMETAQKKIREAILAGRLEYAGQKRVQTILNPGQARYVPSFRPVRKPS